MSSTALRLLQLLLELLGSFCCDLCHPRLKHAFRVTAPGKASGILDRTLKSSSGARGGECRLCVTGLVLTLCWGQAGSRESPAPSAERNTCGETRALQPFSPSSPGTARPVLTQAPKGARDTASPSSLSSSLRSPFLRRCRRFAPAGQVDAPSAPPCVSIQVHTEPQI